MKDFNEAVLTINVQVDVAEAYKKAIEAENSPTGLRDSWNGNYAYVVIGDQTTLFAGEEVVERADEVKLTIQLLSHTLPNLQETVRWYEKIGCTVVRTDYK